MPPGDEKYAAVSIERKWSVPELQGREILEALSEVYGLISDVVLDAHFHLNQTGCISQEQPHQDFKSAYHRTGTLECMFVGVDLRTERFELSTGNILEPARRVKPIRDDRATIDKRYGLIDADRISAWQTLDPVAFAEKLLFIAKRIGLLPNFPPIISRVRSYFSPPGAVVFPVL